jgi:NAD(P)-dependent dehydrogenase (short-subunit alcohol dehydrogenase family)
MEITGKIAIVTGASGGIGRATARYLAREGATVVLAARSRDKLAALAKELPGSLAVPTDMRNEKEVHDLVATAVKKFGRVDILVNNAGQGLRAPIESVDPDDYRAVIELNLFGPLRAMQAVIPVMRKQGGGTIINISSLTSKNHFPLIGAYASTKSALNTLSLTAREELAKDHILVSAFLPKMTATDFGANARGEKYNSAAGRPGMKADTPEAVAERIGELIRTEEPEMSM